MVQLGRLLKLLIYPLAPWCLQSPDSEAAGAAFVTLMALMGDEAASGQQPGAAAIAAVGQGAGAREEGEAAPGTTSLMLDAHFGLAAPVGDQAPPACSLDSVPTDAQLMQALRSNGYRTGHAAAGSGRSGRQQQGAALGQQQQQQEEAEEEGRVVRVQTIKLILRTAAAVCRYRWKVRWLQNIKEVVFAAAAAEQRGFLHRRGGCSWWILGSATLASLLPCPCLHMALPPSHLPACLPAAPSGGGAHAEP